MDPKDVRSWDDAVECVPLLEAIHCRFPGRGQIPFAVHPDQTVIFDDGTESTVSELVGDEF